jgi:MYXO-CTERM domain-containing protein
LRTEEGWSNAASNMRTAMLILGTFAVLMGLLWVGQGFGLVQWPASSFMIDQRPWVTRGALLAVVGLVLIAAARRRKRP